MGNTCKYCPTPPEEIHTIPNRIPPLTPAAFYNENTKSYAQQLG